jgi:uncharacterized small protein (DUF1192 family)
MTTTYTPLNIPFEEQRKEALQHYEYIATKAHYWSSFVVAAIKAYQDPEKTTNTPWMTDEQIEANANNLGITQSDKQVMEVTPWFLFNVSIESQQFVRNAAQTIIADLKAEVERLKNVDSAVEAIRKYAKYGGDVINVPQTLAAINVMDAEITRLKAEKDTLAKGFTEKLEEEFQRGYNKAMDETNRI